MKAIKQCDCCKQDFELPCSIKEYRFKIKGKFYCGWKCYSKTFDSQFKASSINVSSRLSYLKGRMVDKGYERHGSR